MKNQMKFNLPLRMSRCVPVLLAALVSGSCSKMFKPTRFDTPEHALQACRIEMRHVRQTTGTDIKTLSKVVCRWQTVQDSAFSALYHIPAADSGSVSAMNLDNGSNSLNETGLHGGFIMEYMYIRDSVRTMISSLMFCKNRTLDEVVAFMTATAHDRRRIQKSTEYRQAMRFFEKMDTQPLFPDLRTAVTEYEKLLAKNGPFKKENELYTFIQDEDRCFRSLMEFLSETDNEELQAITEETNNLFEEWQNDVAGDRDNKDNERIMLYLTMRLNRRIMQNALACRNDIEHGVPLDGEQAGNYRWMVIQPFMSIGQEAMSFMTDTQLRDLSSLASKLPELLARLDSREQDSLKKSERARVENLLAQYLLKAYIYNIL